MEISLDFKYFIEDLQLILFFCHFPSKKIVRIPGGIPCLKVGSLVGSQVVSVGSQVGLQMDS